MQTDNHILETPHRMVYLTKEPDHHHTAFSYFFLKRKSRDPKQFPSKKQAGIKDKVRNTNVFTDITVLSFLRFIKVQRARGSGDSSTLLCSTRKSRSYLPCPSLSSLHQAGLGPVTALPSWLLALFSNIQNLKTYLPLATMVLVHTLFSCQSQKGAQALKTNSH